MTSLRAPYDGAPVDGNAVAGLLAELFAFDITASSMACNGCGSVATVGAIRVYGGAMGAIFRCAVCDTVMMRLVRTPTGFVMDLRGARQFEARPAG